MADISITESEGKEYNIKDEVARELIEKAHAKKISGKYTWNDNKMNSNSDLIYGSNWSQKVNFSADDIDFTEMRVENGQLYYDHQWWAEEGYGICGSPNDLDFGTEPQTVSEEFYNIIMTCTNEGTGASENTEEGLGDWTKLNFSTYLPSGLYLFKVCISDAYNPFEFGWATFTCYVEHESACINAYFSPWFKTMTEGVEYCLHFDGDAGTTVKDRINSEEVLSSQVDTDKNTIINNTYYIKLA